MLNQKDLKQSMSFHALICLSDILALWERRGKKTAYSFPSVLEWRHFCLHFKRRYNRPLLRTWFVLVFNDTGALLLYSAYFPFHLSVVAILKLTSLRLFTRLLLLVPLSGGWNRRWVWLFGLGVGFFFPSPNLIQQASSQNKEHRLPLRDLRLTNANLSQRWDKDFSICTPVRRNTYTDSTERKPSFSSIEKDEWLNFQS